MPVPQGRHGYLTIGGTTYPVYRFQNLSPRNLVSGHPLGNTWGTNNAEGLKTGRLFVEFMVREKATEVLALAFWNLWLSRTFTAGFDDTSALSIVAASGRRTRTYANAKAESFTLRIAKGAPVGLSAVFVSPAPPTAADQTPTDYSKTVDNSPPLMFDKVSFGGVSGSVYGCEITFSNNHMPNGPLDASKTLSSWDAGVITCGARFTFAEHVAGEPFADGASLTVTLTGAATRILTLTSVTVNNPLDLDAGVGQLFQPYDCLVQGAGGITPAAPLVVT